MAAPDQDALAHPSLDKNIWNSVTSTPHRNGKRTVLYVDGSIRFGDVAYRDPNFIYKFRHPAAE